MVIFNIKNQLIIKKTDFIIINFKIINKKVNKKLNKLKKKDKTLKV